MLLGRTRNTERTLLASASSMSFGTREGMTLRASGVTVSSDGVLVPFVSMGVEALGTGGVDFAHFVAQGGWCATRERAADWPARERGLSDPCALRHVMVSGRGCGAPSRKVSRKHSRFQDAHVWP